MGRLVHSKFIEGYFKLLHKWTCDSTMEECEYNASFMWFNKYLVTQVFFLSVFMWLDNLTFSNYASFSVPNWLRAGWGYIWYWYHFCITSTRYFSNTCKLRWFYIFVQSCQNALFLPSFYTAAVAYLVVSQDFSKTRSPLDL